MGVKWLSEMRKKKKVKRLWESVGLSALWLEILLCRPGIRLNYVVQSHTWYLLRGKKGN